METMAKTVRKTVAVTKTMAVAAAVVLLGVVEGAPAAAQAGPAGPVEIALAVHGGKPIVPVLAPDGGELWFVLSTGTAVTVLSESTAARLGDAPALTLGGVSVSMEGSQTVPDERLTNGGRTLDGMVGVNTLSRFEMLVDVPGGRLVLAPVGREVSWEGVALSEPVRLRVLHGIVLSLDVELNGKSYPAMLDLGTPLLLVNQAVMDGARVEGNRARLQVGSATFPDLTVEVSDHPVIQMFSPAGAGFVLVGGSLAQECVIVVSWVHAELRTCVR
jgi:hypothetical protein